MKLKLIIPFYSAIISELSRDLIVVESTRLRVHELKSGLHLFCSREHASFTPSGLQSRDHTTMNLL